MDKPIKIDGYCAWHPKKGFRIDTMASRYSESLDFACRALGYYEDLDFGGGAIDSEDFHKDDWQIKAVRLIEVATPPTTKED